MISDHPANRKLVKQTFEKQGEIVTKEKKKHEDSQRIYEMYYDFHEKVGHIVSHRILAINRLKKKK